MTSVVPAGSRLAWGDLEGGAPVYTIGRDSAWRLPTGGRSLLLVLREAPTDGLRRDLERALGTLADRWGGPVSLLLAPQPGLPLRPVGALRLARLLADPDRVRGCSVLSSPGTPQGLTRGVVRLLAAAGVAATRVTLSELGDEISRVVAVALPGP